jgi:large subunit ribosomal protein L10
MKKQILKKVEREVSEKKKGLLDESVSLIKKHNTIMIALIENISSAKLQKLKKLLSDKAKIRVIKKTMVLRAFEKAKVEKKGIEILEKSLLRNFAVIFSDLDVFELAAILSENKTRVAAKPGYISGEDIVVEAGPTDLPAGPIISELSKAKIKASIEGGKIIIKESTIVAKAGKPVSLDVATVLSKLEVLPVVISLKPIAAYDSKSGKVYENIMVDREEALEQIKQVSGNAFNFALNLEYISKETIEFLLIKAESHSSALELKFPKEEKKEKQEESKQDKEEKIDKKEAKEETKQEEQKETIENKSEEKKE